MNQNNIHNVEHSYTYSPFSFDVENHTKMIRWIESITHRKIHSIKKQFLTDAEDEDDSVVFEVVFEESDEVYTVIIKLGKKYSSHQNINQNKQNAYEKAAIDFHPSSCWNFKC